MKTLLVSLILLSVFSNTYGFGKFPRFLGPKMKSSEGSTSLTYNVQYFEQEIDNFRFDASLGTFQQRYIYADQYWGSNSYGSCPGPIFFYTGNEGDIFMFFNNTGFVTDYLAEKYGALVIFAEHRYYGESLPFGQDSFDLNNVGYLTTEQALADYAVLIRTLKTDLNAQDCPVITFGGSYGGMLSAWFRLKYPHIVDGAIAASAPILQFYGTGVSQWVFNEIATSDFEGQCSKNMAMAFDEIQNMAMSATGKQQLSDIFKVCDETPILTDDDVANFISWIEAGLTYMAMIDYPYPTNFLEPVPAWPVAYSCNVLQDSLEQGLVEAFAAAVGVYYNYTGEVQCNNLDDTASAGLSTNAWDYQACTEMVMPISSNGTSDMFPFQLFNLTQQIEYCQATWGATPRANWVITNFGGDLLSNGMPNLVGSNIVFSNGKLDPWSGGGVLQNVSDSLVAVSIAQGAHHLDLRKPNDADPISVIEARIFEETFISKWIQEKYDSLSN